MTDATLFAFIAAFSALVAWPAVAAAHRRRLMRDASEVAGSLCAMALAVRKAAACLPIDESLCRRARRLCAAEVTALLLAQELPQPRPELWADTAQRLALRLKRRVAFERKMLARTASGRRRGAVAASIPALVLLAFNSVGIQVPLAALLFVVAIEALGCWMLWRAARVDI
jgi:hypothetical protein